MTTKPSKITLFGNRFSGHAYKIALFLALNKIPHNYEAINLSQPRGERPEFFRKHARYGEVPLLIVEDKAFVQSNAILLHLSQLFGIMSGGEEKARVNEWLMWEQSRLGSSLPNLRFEKKFKTNSDPAVQAWLKARLLDDLAVLNTHLTSGDGFVVGASPTIADCSLAGYLFWLSDVDLAISDWPHAQAWLNRIENLEGWKHPDKLMTQEKPV